MPLLELEKLIREGVDFAFQRSTKRLMGREDEHPSRCFLKFKVRESR